MNSKARLKKCLNRFVKDVMDDLKKAGVRVQSGRRLKSRMCRVLRFHFR